MHIHTINPVFLEYPPPKTYLQIWHPTDWPPISNQSNANQFSSSHFNHHRMTLIFHCFRIHNIEFSFLLRIACFYVAKYSIFCCYLWIKLTLFLEKMRSCVMSKRKTMIWYFGTCIKRFSSRNLIFGGTTVIFEPFVCISGIDSKTK